MLLRGLMKMEKDDYDLETIKNQAVALASSQAFGSEGELYDLFKTSQGCLKKHLGAEGAIKDDPELALEAFKVIAKANVDLIEAKRKALEALLKAKSLMNNPFNGLPQPDNTIIEGNKDDADPMDADPDPDSVKNSSFEG